MGFGMMRLPMLEENGEKRVDEAQVCRMVDRFLEEGFCYFDTAHGYLEEKSEIAVRECLAKRYPRETYILTNKLSGNYFKAREEIRPLFEKQLEACGVAYFDYYLHHALDGEKFEKFKGCGAFEVVKELKAEGKVHHIGMSFHDKAPVLDQILTERPEIEVVQIQFNYTDYEDPDIQAREVYEVCRKHNKPVFIMEPVRGGRLANLSPRAGEVLSRLGGGSQASYAVRFTASFEGVVMVLSGMSSLEQMEDNLSYMKDFRPLEEKELDAVWQVAEILRQEKLISCTACRYCVEGCPKQIPIPEIFSCINDRYQERMEKGAHRYAECTQGMGKASDCIACQACEKICPQHLPVSKLMKKAVRVFEEKK